MAAFTVLFGFPTRTQRLWAWTIHPDLAALIMGGAYGGGAWFFARGLHGGRWHRVAVGWLAVIPFTALLGVATFLHWDRFNHDHVSFWAWLILYTATPILLPVLWLRNAAGGGPAPGRLRPPAADPPPGPDQRPRRRPAAGGGGDLRPAPGRDRAGGHGR